MMQPLSDPPACHLFGRVDKDRHPLVRHQHSLRSRDNQRPGQSTLVPHHTGLVLTGFGGGGQEWKHLEATVHVPAATAHCNGTALQLRISPKTFSGQVLWWRHNTTTSQPKRSRAAINRLYRVASSL